MKLINQRIPMDCNIFLYGDDHEGSALRHEEGWKKLIYMMRRPYAGLKTKYNFGIDHGDPVEAIMMDDPRYDGKTTQSNILHQIHQAIKHRKPIASKILLMLESNHPEKLWRYGPITQEICTQLGVQYGTWSSVITYRNSKSKLLFKHFATHGCGCISTSADDPVRQKSNLILSLKRKLKEKMGDCALMSMGHTHKILIAPPTQQLYITSNKKTGKLKQKYTESPEKSTYIHPDLRWYVNTGSFLKLYGDNVSGYAERFGYNPMELGFAVALIRRGHIAEVRKIVI